MPPPLKSYEQKMNEDIKAYIDQRDTMVEQKIKLWIMSSVIAQVVVFVPVIFLLGGIYTNANSSLAILKDQQTAVAVSSARLDAVEARQLEMRAWARTKGYIPFTPEPIVAGAPPK